MHVESSVESSILLASLLLKVSMFGLLRFYNITWFSTIIFNFFVITIFCSLSVGACFILLSIDLKKTIAYSSIVHMNFSFLCIIHSDFTGIFGLQLCLISHGIFSCFMFYLINFSIDSLGSRSLGIVCLNIDCFPVLILANFLIFLSNCGFPISFGFIVEFLLILSMIQLGFDILVFAYFLTSLLILVGIFNLYLKIFI